MHSDLRDGEPDLSVDRSQDMPNSGPDLVLVSSDLSDLLQNDAVILTENKK